MRSKSEKHLPHPVQYMKRPPSCFYALSLMFGLASSTTQLLAQGTAFTYQGRLSDDANPASGSYDLSFALYDDWSSGLQQGHTATNVATQISNGLFTVTLDFGNQFTGAPRWLAIGVRTNGGGTFTVLSPRQNLTPVPYAITAGSVTGPIALDTNFIRAEIAAANSVALNNLSVLSNAVFDLSPSASVTDSTLYYTYGSDTNTLSIAASSPAPAYSSNFTWNASGFFTNNASGGLRRALYHDGSKWNLTLNAAGTLLATNAPSGLFGEYRTNLTMGENWVVTYQVTLRTNIHPATVTRTPVVWADDFGARGDGIKLYQVTASNSVVSAPNASFTTNDLGKTFCLYTDSTNLSYVLSHIVAVNNATNITLAPDVSRISVASMEAVYGTDNSAFVTNALYSLLPTGGTLKFGNGIYLFATCSTIDSANAAVINLPEPVVERWPFTYAPTNPTVTITIEGSQPPVVWTQIIRSFNHTVGRPWAGTVLYNVAKPRGATNSFFLHQPNPANDVSDQYFDEYGWARYFFRNLTIRQPVIPRFHGINFHRGGTLAAEYCVLDADIPADFFDTMARPKVFPSNIGGYFSGNQTNNTDQYVNVTNVAGLPIGVWTPGAWNYAGSQLREVQVYFYGIGVFAGEHTYLENCNFDADTIGMFVEITELYPYGIRGSSSAVVGVRPMFSMDPFPIVISTNGNAHFLNLFGPVFENDDFTWGWPAGTRTITDPLNYARGVVEGIDGLDNFKSDSTQLKWDSINSGVSDFGGRAVRNAAFAGDGAGLTNLNASALAYGKVPGARLPTNVALLNSSPGFSGSVSAAMFSGSGAGLTGISAEAITGGITTNIAFLAPGGSTNVLRFTNGILRALQ